jgi:hypothetical protein
MQKLLPLFLRTTGFVLVITGLVAAYYGPFEIFVFYLFSEGGQFYYDGFGVGSLWFAALVVQNIAYYLVAALFLPVGIGHLKLRRWSLTLAQLYSWFWLGAGIWLVGNGIWLVPSLYRLELREEALSLQWVPLGIFFFVFLILLPALAVWFYNSRQVKATFAAHDPQRYWTEKYPFPLLALSLLFVIMIIVLHVGIFFQGVFPLFGQIMLGRQAAPFIALCVLILGILIYGTVRLKGWAWWGALIFISALTISAVLSFSRHSLYDISLLMSLPAYEMEFIDKLTPLHHYHLVGLVALPLLVALGLVVYSKRYFEQGNGSARLRSLLSHGRIT